MRDDLIGFVLGALDLGEHEELRRKIEQDESLQRQLRIVERGLTPLRWSEPPADPPEGLAARTCERLGSLIWLSGTSSQWGLEPGLPSGGTGSLAVEAGSTGDGTPDVEEAFEVRVGGKAGSDLDRVSADGPATNGVRPISAEWSGGRFEPILAARQWTVADFVVAAGVCLAVSCLFFPAIANSRHHWQVAGCQNHMRELGQAFADYSGGPGGYFPLVPASGPAAVAGIYGPKLMEKGLVNDGRVFLCPAKGSTIVLRIPRPQEILAAQGPQLVRLHRTMGGDYAYAFGYLQNGRLQGIRNQGSSQGVLLADAPLEQIRDLAIGTHGRGQNVLFEDGHVRFLTKRLRPGTTNDDLFVNADGLQQAGVDANDYVLGASHVAPFPVGRFSVEP